MPTYEYACRACGHRFEEFQSIKADPIRICPQCQEERVERLISGGSGLLFKGSGFYQTDYRSDSYKAGEKSDGKPAEGGSTSGDAKPDAKPAAAPAGAKDSGGSSGSSGPASSPASSDSSAS